MANSRKTSRDRLKSKDEVIANNHYQKSKERLIIEQNSGKSPRYSGNTKSWYI